MDAAGYLTVIFIFYVENITTFTLYMSYIVTMDYFALYY